MVGIVLEILPVLCQPVVHLHCIGVLCPDSVQGYARLTHNDLLVIGKNRIALTRSQGPASEGVALTNRYLSGQVCMRNFLAQLIRLVVLRGSFGHAGDISSARGILLVEYLALDSQCTAHIAYVVVVQLLTSDSDGVFAGMAAAACGTVQLIRKLALFTRQDAGHGGRKLRHLSTVYHLLVIRSYGNRYRGDGYNSTSIDSRIIRVCNPDVDCRRISNVLKGIIKGCDFLFIRRIAIVLDDRICQLSSAIPDGHRDSILRAIVWTVNALDRHRHRIL